MAELLDDLDWQGKVYSTGWTTSRGGVTRVHRAGDR